MKIKHDDNFWQISLEGTECQFCITEKDKSNVKSHFLKMCETMFEKSFNKSYIKSLVPQVVQTYSTLCGKQVGEPYNNIKPIDIKDCADKINELVECFNTYMRKQNG